jgi:hypothetical protein
MKTAPGQGVAARPVVSKWLPVSDVVVGDGGTAGSSTRPLPPNGLYRIGRRQRDQVLVARLRDRDEAAYAVVMDAWSDGMLRLVRPLVSADDSAAEIVRDTWLAVVDDIGMFEGRSSLRSWVYRLLMDTAKRRGARGEGAR